MTQFADNCNGHMSNSAKILAGYMRLTGVFNSKALSEALDIPLRTIQRLKLECAIYANDATYGVSSGHEQNATDGASGANDAPTTPDAPNVAQAQCADSRAHAYKENPSGLNITNNKNTNKQTTVESVAAREDDTTVVAMVRPSDHFIECKKAFNGSTSDMLAEIAQHMNALPDEPHVSQWLASLLRANGTEAVQQSYQMLLTARAEQKPIARVLPWWSKTAATLKANPAVKPKKPAYMMRY